MEIHAPLQEKELQAHTAVQRLGRAEMLTALCWKSSPHDKDNLCVRRIKCKENYVDS